MSTENEHVPELEPENEDGDFVEIYSKRAIFWFSFVFASIFGSVMLMLNLRSAGYKQAGHVVLLFGIVYYFAGSIALNLYFPHLTINGSPPKDIFIVGFTTLAINFVGGLILTQYFYKRYFPENDYYPKSIRQPLIVAGLIFLFVILLQGIAG